MPFVEIPGMTGLVYTPEKGKEKKNMPARTATAAGSAAIRDAAYALKERTVPVVLPFAALTKYLSNIRF